MKRTIPFNTIIEIKSIEKIEHFVPKSSCGTGYSEPDLFNIILTDGTNAKIYIDIWYRSVSSIRNEFLSALKRNFANYTIKNIAKAYEMYVNQIARTSCPYTKEEILKYPIKEII